MSNELPKRFQPNRVIYLSTENTGYKTAIEVQHAVEQLRSLGWLCVYNESIRPIHLSFDDENMLSAFKKSCDKIGCMLKSPNFKGEYEDFSALDKKVEKENIGSSEVKSSYEDPSGKVHLE